MTTVYEDLIAALKVKRSSRDSVQDHLLALTKAADRLEEDEWDGLSQEVQEWVNEAVAAHDAGDAIALPEGLDDEGEDEDDKPAKKTKKTESKKVSGKKAAKKASKEVESESEEDEHDNEDDEEEQQEAMEKKPAKKTASVKAGSKKEAEKPTKKAMKEAKPEKAKKPVKAKKEGGASRAFPGEAKIKVLVKENPFRAGSSKAERFDAFKKGISIAEAYKLGASAAGLRDQIEKGYIKIG